MEKAGNLKTATLANGCFWCTEAIFKRVKGVDSVASGFSGGERESPSYDQIHSGATGHAECIQVTFDPGVMPFEKILDIFFATHNPTTLNQDGANYGTEYRSAIFYHTEEQKKVAEDKIKEIDESGKYIGPVVTEVSLYKGFYKAEDEHQNFYESGMRPDYCRVIIDPKIQKLLTNFKDQVKEEYK